jgi:hypothetical protein
MPICGQERVDLPIKYKLSHVKKKWRGAGKNIFNWKTLSLTTTTNL